MTVTRPPFVLTEEDVAIPPPPITVLMVDDQAMIGAVVGKMLESESDIHFHFCNDPKQALALAVEINPTVILQDLVMPDVDGLTLVREFREHRKTRDIPLIVLSTKEEPETKYRAFSLGANDYMVKLPDKLEVVARIRYHSGAYINKLERDRAFEALEASQESLRRELEEAERYVRSILPDSMEDEFLAADNILITSTSLGGDAFGYHWLDDEHFACYLLDVCGHGVGAALLSVSAMNVLRNQSLAGVDFKDPVAVLCGLNRTFDMEKQNQMYFTIWYGVYHKKTRELHYSVGGHPAAVLVREGTHTYEALKTPGIIIGAMPDEAPFQEGVAKLAPGDRLYLFSDGVFEVFGQDNNKMLDFEGFAKVLVQQAPSGTRKVDAMVDFVRKYQGRDAFEDDFSLVEFICK